MWPMLQWVKLVLRPQERGVSAVRALWVRLGRWPRRLLWCIVLRVGIRAGWRICFVGSVGGSSLGMEGDDLTGAYPETRGRGPKGVGTKGVWEIWGSCWCLGVRILDGHIR